MEGNVAITVDDPDEPPKRPPPPPPPKRLSRPKITLSIPETVAPTNPNPASARIPMTPRSQVYWGPMSYHGKVPVTPGSHVSDPHGNPYVNPFMHMYQNKASEFMFKQFAGFKDFTMNTAKSGLSAGEKSAFWFYNKLRTLSKKWFTHLFLTLCLVLYSVMGAAIFMAVEGTHEDNIIKELEKNGTLLNITLIRRDFAAQIEDAIRSEIQPEWATVKIMDLLEQYDQNYTEFTKQPTGKTWSFWNAMFYAGTIYTTIAIVGGTYNMRVLETCRNRPTRLFEFFKDILRQNNFGVKVVMSEGGNEEKRLTLQIPIIKAESETQTLGHLISKSPDKNSEDMDADDQKLSIRKRRNLSKNRGQSARQREKTPEPGRTPIQEDTTTSDDEDSKPLRNSRELEADNTYEEMRRLVLEKANVKDPVYDIDTDEVMEQRALAAHDRRRRSISPFALPEKSDKEEGYRFERKGSFIDPTNKLLSTNYNLSPKDEDTTKRRNSLTIEPPRDRRNSLTPPTPTSASPKESNLPFPLPTTPKKLEEMVYPDEVKNKQSEDKPAEDKPKNLKTPVTKESVFTFEDKDVESLSKGVSPKAAETKVVETKAAEVKSPSVKATSKTIETQTTPTVKPPQTPKVPEVPTPTGEIVTKVIQLERTPSRKLSQDIKPTVEIRERIVRTPSRKMTGDVRPIIPKQAPAKPAREDLQNKAPPVKPARSKSATRFGSKTSESEMSEDQGNQQNIAAGAKRKIIPIPRRFMKNRSPRANRSQSVARADEINVIDRSGTEMTQTSREILELMQKARARSLSIPKDDPRLPVEYKRYSKTLQTPQNKTPVSRTSRGISCPKTIQIISDKEILSGLTSKTVNKRGEPEKPPRRSSGYIDASQSEYTSSCYSSSPSENEYEFDLSERTAELTRKLKLLSQEADKYDSFDSIDKVARTEEEIKSVLRKRSVAVNKNGGKKDRRESIEDKKSKKVVAEKQKLPRTRWKLMGNWQQFKEDQKADYESLISLRNRCVCDLLLMIFMFGLGGMMFRSLEGSFENAYKCGTRNVKRDFIESLWRGSHYLREEDWKSMARKKLFEFENQLHTAHEAGVTSYSGQPSWNFMNSFVYCMTIVTTIGYGHIAPKTTYGRVATIVYAIIGIPLFLIVLADFGKLFTRIIKFFWAFIRRFYYTRSCRKVRKTVPMQEMMKGLNVVYDVVRRPSQIFSEEDMEGVGQGEKPPPVGRKPSDVPPPLPPKPGQVTVKDIDTEPDTPVPSLFEIDDEFNLPISVAIFILVVYIIIGATVYNIWETWNFFESFYFVFISMSTIGLGDLVPDHPMFMMASILYLVFGLALTSMCINVVQVKLSNTFRQASAKLGATIGLKVADEDGSLVPITPPPTEIAPVHKPKTDKEKEETKTKENEDNDTNKES